MKDDILVADGLRKHFGRKRVLDDVDLAIGVGRVTVLLGENGAGKSTMLRCALGLVRPNAGSIRVFGHDPARRPGPVRDGTGYVPDVPDADGSLTVTDLFSFLQPQYAAWDAGEAARLAELFSVPTRTSFRHLSRGEGMKAMLAAALAPRPRLLLLDEPFAGLDPLAREDVLRAVISEIRTGQRTVLCATHDLDVAARIADDVAILSNGRIVRHGTLEDVLEVDAEAARAATRLRDAYVATVTGTREPEEVLV